MILARKVVDRGPDALFVPRIGQLLLALIFVLGMVVLIGSSAYDIQGQNIEREQLLAEESDASALVFTQRESFNVALALSLWDHGDATPRDVQIARALLGQRLSVVTSTGTTTYDLVSPAYRESLRKFDSIIRNLPEVAPQQRLPFFADIDPALEEFLIETRQLSLSFQTVSRNSIEEVAQLRFRTELVRTITLAVMLLALAALAFWSALDISRGYRRSRDRLREQASELAIAEQRLNVTRHLDVVTAHLLRKVGAGEPRNRVVEDLKESIEEVLPGVRIDINAKAGLGVHVMAGSEVDPATMDIVMARVADVVSVLADREAAVQLMEFERQHDSLTGLPTRSLLAEAVQDAVEHVDRSGGIAAVALLDIDQFRSLNNSLGYAAGDAVLIEFADRLRHASFPNEFLARLSGDEFAYVSHFQAPEEALTRLKQVFQGLQFDTMVGGVEVQVTTSMGAALSEANQRTASELLRCGAMAMYLANDGERATSIVYSDERDARLSGVIQEDIAIRNALRYGEFRVYFQPIMRLAIDEPAGYEALVRWERPSHGLVMPDDFLPNVHRAGIAIELGKEIMEEAMRTWSRTLLPTAERLGLPTPYISINVDGLQLQESDFSAFAAAAARRHQVPFSAVVLEVTEHILTSDPAAIAQLADLRAQGFRIALDDFGTGYSALSQAQNLPLDLLKIDRSFLPGQVLEGRERRLVADIRQIATTLGLALVAEGVETLDVAETLSALDVEFAQGYFFSRALSETAVAEWMTARRAAVRET